MNDSPDTLADLRRWAEEPVHGARLVPADPNLMDDWVAAKRADLAKLEADDRRYGTGRFKWEGAWL